MTQQPVKIGRNDPCHCGSGKKYKTCHLPIEESERAGNALPSDSKEGDVLTPGARIWKEWEDAYADANFKRKATLLHELISGEDLPEDDTVLACFEELADRAESKGEREMFDVLADLLRARRGATNEIFAMLEMADPASIDVQELHLKIRHYEEWPLSSLRDWIARLQSGESRWRREDFAVTRREWEMHPALRDPLRENIQSLIHGFRGFLHRESGYSWSRADLAASAMLEILMESVEGHLKAEPARKGAPNPWADKCIRVLCPSPDILDSHLSRLLNGMPAYEYRALSLCEGLPHWFVFLGRMGLLGEAEGRPILRSLSPLFKEVGKSIGKG